MPSISPLTCVVVALIAPQVYLACKHKKLKTLIAALTLQRIPSIQALSAFKKQGSQIYMPRSLGINYHHYYNCGNHNCVPLQGM